MFGNMRKESFGHHDFRSGSRRDDMFDDPKDSFNNVRSREGIAAYKRKIEMDRRSSGVDNMERIEREHRFHTSHLTDELKKKNKRS